MTPEERKTFRRSRYGKKTYKKQSPPLEAIRRAPVKTQECVRCKKEKPLIEYRWLRDHFSKYCVVCLEREIKYRKKQKQRRTRNKIYDAKRRKELAHLKKEERERIIALQKEREKKLKADVERRLKMKQHLFNQWVKGGGFHEYIEANKNDQTSFH